jgi:hypothetical protein
MNAMNEAAKEILAKFPVDPTVGDLYALSERDSPRWVLDELDRLRRWAMVPGNRGTLRPSPEYLGFLLARGRDALIKIYRAFEETTSPEVSTPVLKALGAFVRNARAHAVIGWDINNLRAGDGRGRLLLTLDPALDERLRNTAAAEKESLVGFIRRAIASRIEEIESGRPRATA